MRQVFLLEQFLPDGARDAFHAYASKNQHRFEASTRTLNDAEYRNAWTLRDLGPFPALFENALLAAWRDVLLSLAMEVFTPTHHGWRLSMLRPGAYRKPRADARHGDEGTKLSVAYVLGAPPRQYEGGDLRFFDHDPYNTRGLKIRRLLEVDGSPNSMLIFPGDLFYELSEISAGPEGFSSTCFLLDGNVR